MKKKNIRKKTLTNYSDLSMKMKKEIMVENQAMSLAFKYITELTDMDTKTLAKHFFGGAIELVNKLPDAAINKYFDLKDKGGEVEHFENDSTHGLAVVRFHLDKD